MIKCDKGNVLIRGSNAMVLAEVSTLVLSLYCNVFIGDKGMKPDEAKATILKAVEDGFMTEDEAKAKASEAIEGFSDFIGVLEKLLKGLGDD